MADRPVPVPALWQAPAGQTPPLIPPGATIGPSFGGTVGGVTSVGAIAPIASSGGTTPVISLDLSGVTAATYGDATHVGSFTVDAHGLLTAAANVLITGTAPGGAAGGDLSGTYPNPTVAKINTVALGSTTATAGNLLIGSGSAWVTQPMSGDVTITSGGVTAIGTNKVTNTQLAQMAAHTVKSNIAGSTANAADNSLSDIIVADSLLTTKGDLMTFSTVPTNLPVGSNNNVLTPDSSQAKGLKWETLSALIDAAIGSTQGDILYRDTSLWQVLAPGPDSTYFLNTQGSGANPRWAVPSATGGTGWVTALDYDFTAIPTTTLGSDTNFTLTPSGGTSLTWTKTGSTNDRVSMVVTNGTGLVIAPKTTGTYNATPTRTCPQLYTDLSTIIPQFYLGSPFRIWYYMSADGIASTGDFSGVSIDNLSSSATTLAIGIVSRANLSGTRIIQYAGALGASTLTSFNANNNVDRVVRTEFPTGALGTQTVFTGSASGGGVWPSVTVTRPAIFQTTSNAGFTNAQDFVTGLPMKLLIFGQCSSGTPTYTIARIRVDYQVR